VCKTKPTSTAFPVYAFVRQVILKRKKECSTRRCQRNTATAPTRRRRRLVPLATTATPSYAHLSLFLPLICQSRDHQKRSGPRSDRDGKRRPSARLRWWQRGRDESIKVNGHGPPLSLSLSKLFFAVSSRLFDMTML